MKAAFYTQVYHPVHNPQGVEHTEDCGPTSLAMALVSLGLKSQLQQLVDAPCDGHQDLIDRARFAMFSERGRPINRDKCSYEEVAPGRWNSRISARQTLTNIEDLERGASNCGGLAERVTRRILEGSSIPNLILAGDPSLPGAYGRRMGVTYVGGHFIFLPAQPNGESLLVHDPLRLDGPGRISTHELKRFLAADIFDEWIGVRVFSGK